MKSKTANFLFCIGVSSLLISHSAFSERSIKTAPFVFRNHFPVTANVAANTPVFGRSVVVFLYNNSAVTQKKVTVTAIPLASQFSDNADVGTGFKALMSDTWNGGIDAVIKDGVTQTKGPVDIAAGANDTFEFDFKYVGPGKAGVHRTLGAVVFLISIPQSDGSMVGRIESTTGIYDAAILTDNFSHAQLWNIPIFMDINAGRPF